MKTRLVVVLVVCCIFAGGLGWYMSRQSTPESATKSADTQTALTTAPTPVPVAVVGLIKVPAPIVQVQQPVMPAAPLAAAPVSPAPAANDPQPQTDLKSCVSQMMTLLQARDLVALVKTVMPPTAQQRMIDAGEAADPETMAAQIRARIPTIDQDMTDMLQALQSVQGQEPEMNQDGTQATYHLPNPVGRFTDIKFEQQDGKWYFN